MPFVKKNDSQGSQPPTDVSNIFIGRTNELLFFVQNILQPEDPTHNIISIFGQGGVGKSTLLARFTEEAHSPNFKDYCLTAIVDERQMTPVSIMDKFADQLHLKGKFEKALRQYKEMLHRLESEGYITQGTIIHNIPDFASAAAEIVPIAGPLLREGVKAGTKHFLERYQADQLHRNADILEDPLAALTKAFVEELNNLVENRVTPRFRRVRQLRVILFLDTFEQLASDVVPWLLDYFLEAEIKNNVVLVIAGRDALEQSTPDGPKRWLPYHDNHTIYSIFLDGFTKEETHLYLAERGIADSDRVSAIWQLSQGLPLYLGLLTSNLQGKVDPTANVVANFLRWIPEQEHDKRRLALDAALFSRPFNQDDLEAFGYLPEHERPAFYRWLIGQPFARSQDGRYSYHDLAKELFSRYLYQHSRKGYYATRRVLAQHYQQMLEEIQREEGKEVYHSAEWFALVLALLCQLLCLSDEASHIKAIEQVLYVLIHRDVEQVFQERIREIRRMFRELFQTAINDTSLRTQQIIKHFHQWFEPSTRGKEQLETINFLLHTVLQEPSFPSELLSRLYQIRGYAYSELKGHHQQATDDFQRALALLDSAAHGEKGRVYLDLDEDQQAIREFNKALEIDPKDARVYGNRGWTYFFLKEYQRAINDFERILELDPNNTQGHNGRGQIHMRFKEYEQALFHFERIVELLPAVYLGYCLRGCTYRELKEYQRAIDDFERALDLHPDCVALEQRGYTYLWLKDMKQAGADFTRSWEAFPTVIECGWMAEWVNMCQPRISLPAPEPLEELISNTPYPTRYYPRTCRGVALLLHERHEEAVVELEQAIPLAWKRDPWDAYFWQGMACLFLGREKEAIEAIEKALEGGMPPVLLAPLRWFEQERHDFYKKFIVPLLAKYE